MALHIRFDGDLAILSNFARLLNDPRHFDAGRDVKELLDQGYRHFILDLTGLHELGSTSIGLLMTLTRQVRQGRGELVLASVNRPTQHYLQDMRMDDYWEIFPNVDQARRFFRPAP
jgi:anti-sigma B factor antagonist